MLWGPGPLVEYSDLHCFLPEWMYCIYVLKTAGKCFSPMQVHEHVKCRSGESSSSLTVRFFFFTWNGKILPCVYEWRHTRWFICFYDCPGSRAQSCVERPKDMQECTCLHTNTHTLTHTYNYFFPPNFLTITELMVAQSTLMPNFSHSASSSHTHTHQHILTELPMP